jgi:hypothetical protein
MISSGTADRQSIRNRRHYMTGSHGYLKGFVSVAALLVLLAGCASGPDVAEGTIVVEAEDASYSGDIEVNGDPDDGTAQPIPGASGEMLYLKSAGEIEFTFDVPIAGDYLIKLVYAVPASYGDKSQDVLVNGELVGSLQFPATGEPASWEEKWVGVFSLQPGQTTLTVVKNRGYTWFDFASIELVE